MKFEVNMFFYALDSMVHRNFYSIFITDISIFDTNNY